MPTPESTTPSQQLPAVYISMAGSNNHANARVEQRHRDNYQQSIYQWLVVDETTLSATQYATLNNAITTLNYQQSIYQWLVV
ncbi:hypothetical protein BTUL_0084g00020 [Botrytis tulipae]|uniref:Uncharacterized protein n=1 Tax=Botrytis tulipae TaxID=87230 RepID=A0A4Z1EJJ6_9HELO|nr:hypothetical protein BTUL_0084g00020 [Botrytis tulipae]